MWGLKQRIQHRSGWRMMVAAFTLGCATMAQAIEEPRFDVVRTLKDVEIRQYEPYVVAEVVMPSGPNDAGNRAFPILAGYIFGKNKGEKKMAMTAPVTQTAVPMKMEMTAPVTQSTVAQGQLVQFVLPKAVTLDRAPDPVDPRVQIREVPATRVAAIRFSGFWSQSNYEQNLQRLKDTGQSILVIDKYIERLLKLADAHTIIERGRVVWAGDSAALNADRSLWHRHLGV